MTSEREKTKTFRDVAGQAGLKKATIDKLVGEDFDTTDVIKLMTDADIEDLALLQPIGSYICSLFAQIHMKS